MMKSIPAADISQLTTAQMVEVDRLMIEEWHISLVQMMENAGRNFANWPGTSREDVFKEESR